MDFNLPNLGENIDRADVIKVLVKVGDQIDVEQPILELETGKASIDIPAPVAGNVEAIHVNEGDTIKVGAVVMRIAEVDDGTKINQGAAQKSAEDKTTIAKTEQPVSRELGLTQSPQVTVQPSEVNVPASPSVRRFAREIGTAITQVKGSGPMGRISIVDVKSHARQMNEKHSKSLITISGSTPKLPDFSQWGEINSKAMMAIRRSTAEHMQRSWKLIPHVSHCDKADITQLEKTRERYAAKAQTGGSKLTLTAIILKVVAGVLKRFPQFNASIDVENEHIIYKNYYHLGVAVDTDRGLLVPVIRDVDKKGILQISKELAEVAEKARDKKILPEDLQGSSFTISNLGGIGGNHFTPIVNWPETAILGIARSTIEAVYHEGEFVPRKLLPLILSYDHRLIDGADAARFLRTIADCLETPFLIALD